MKQILVFEFLIFLQTKPTHTMKRIALLMLLPVLAIGQKKSGVVYSEHPAYDVVTQSYRVWESVDGSYQLHMTYSPIEDFGTFSVLSPIDFFTKMIS